MQKNVKRYIAISALTLLLGDLNCLAKPLETENKAKRSTAKSNTATQTSTKPTNSKPNETSADSLKQADTQPRKALLDDAASKSSVSDFAKEYAAFMKKATAAIHINWPLKMNAEQKLWSDYKSGKYAKNREFMRNMKLAEPYHNRLRSILHIFEDQKLEKLDFSRPSAAQPK